MWTAPDHPHAGAGQAGNQSRGLWVVQNRHVARTYQRPQLDRDVAERLFVGLARRVVQGTGVSARTVQRVMETLRDPEEFRRAIDHHPANVHPGTPRVGHQRSQHFRDATPACGGVDVPDGHARDPRSGAVELAGFVVADQVTESQRREGCDRNLSNPAHRVPHVGRAHAGKPTSRSPDSPYFTVSTGQEA